MNVNLAPITQSDFTSARSVLNLNHERIKDAFSVLTELYYLFTDASSSAVTVNLPNGTNQANRAYVIVKTDSSANNVIINPLSPQLLNAGASLTLATQGDKAVLVFDNASQSWWSI